LRGPLARDQHRPHDDIGAAHLLGEVEAVEYRVRMPPWCMVAIWPRRATSRSITVTFACSPCAIIAACSPTTPPPTTRTFASAVPGTPPISTPAPPSGAIRW